MATCKIEERDAGRAYPRTCPTCKLGPCRKGHSKALAPTPKENPMTQNYEAERLIERLTQEDKTKYGYYGYVRFNRDGHEAVALIRTQAARIAELETKLQAVLRREADANRAAFAHMRRITALEANGIAARKATAKNYARAEAAEKALAAAEARGYARGLEDANRSHLKTGGECECGLSGPCMQENCRSPILRALAKKEAGE